jgi:hypothetical protein
VIELASADVLIWRLNVELRHGMAFAATAERAASRIGGALLLALAAYIVLAAAWSIWARQGGGILLAGSVDHPRSHPHHVASVAAEIAARRGTQQSGVARRGD